MTRLESKEIKSIVPHMRMMLPTLTDREQQIVRFLLQKENAIIETSIHEVANTIDVSEAMIVKLSKKLGFAGYRELRKMLFQYCQLPVAELYQELDSKDSPAVTIQKIFRNSIQALEETMAILNIDSFTSAVDILSRSTQHDFYGLGGSSTIAKDAEHKFLRIGIRCTAYSDSHLMLMSASLLTKNDMVLAISHSGQTKAVLEAARLAKKRGAKIIALTNYSTSVLAHEADIILCSTARDSVLMGENAAARIAQLNIIDALFFCIAQRNPLVTEENIENTMVSVIQMRES